MIVQGRNRFTRLDEPSALVTREQTPLYKPQAAVFSVQTVYNIIRIGSTQWSRPVKSQAWLE